MWNSIVLRLIRVIGLENEKTRRDNRAPGAPVRAAAKSGASRRTPRPDELTLDGYLCLCPVNLLTTTSVSHSALGQPISTNPTLRIVTIALVWTNLLAGHSAFAQAQPGAVYVNAGIMLPRQDGVSGAVSL